MAEKNLPLGYIIVAPTLAFTLTVEGLHVEDRMYHLPHQENAITTPAPAHTIGTVTALVNGTLFGLILPSGI
jgi:hypothetical protein